MGCRVGITTDLKKRRQFWENKCIGFNNWHSYGHFSREIAQRKETELAKRRGCVAHSGGSNPDNPNAKWYVCFFNFVRER